MLTENQLLNTFGLKSIHNRFPKSGQKQVYLVEKNNSEVVILKIVDSFNDRIIREIEVVIQCDFKFVPKILNVDKFALSSLRWYKRIRKNEEGNKAEWSRKSSSLRTLMKLFYYIEAEKNAILSFEDETIALKGGNKSETEKNG